MKRKTISCLAIVLVLTLMSAPAAWAASIDFSDVSVIADGDGLKILFSDGSKVDEFVHAEHLMPGETIHRSMQITNEINEPYQLTLTAESPWSTPADFINKIRLTLELDGKLTYDGSLGAQLNEIDQYIDNKIDLGVINPGDTHTLSAEFTLPGEVLTNEYQQAHAEVRWVLRAELPKPTEPDTSEETPDEPEEPPGENPQTNDPGNAALWVFGIVLSLCVVAAGVCLVIRAGRKRTS